MPPSMTRLERPSARISAENLHYAFSSFNFTATFLNLLLEVGVERIMFSADYPYALMTRARVSGQLQVSAGDQERIAHRNAERLSDCRALFLARSCGRRTTRVGIRQRGPQPRPR